jgi:hypothetical protein
MKMFVMSGRGIRTARWRLANSIWPGIVMILAGLALAALILASL